MLSGLIERRKKIESEIEAVQSLYYRYEVYAVKFSDMEKKLKSNQDEYSNDESWTGNKKQQFKDEAEQNVAHSRALTNQVTAYRGLLKNWIDHLIKERSIVIEEIEAERLRLEQERKGKMLK